MGLQISPTQALPHEYNIWQQPDLERGSMYSRKGGNTEDSVVFPFEMILMSHLLSTTPIFFDRLHDTSIQNLVEKSNFI
ncbi:unnamed protein product [Protopolystoma xenopodis]|uniref:Uncharacterized protein n=1 Tax=Protopolystoma xenopodis TaxID=117903 RepID=A0A448WXN3_9PLAT|nr:unnamed protein product [Protopolystoma xenopodis]